MIDYLTKSLIMLEINGVNHVSVSPVRVSKHIMQS